MSQHNQTIAWTNEQVNMLCKLWAEGLSATDIGADLGCSRNAVIGKIHRLDVVVVRKQQPSSKPKIRRPHPTQTSALLMRPVIKYRSGTQTKSALPTRSTIKHRSGTKTIFELGMDDCRFPLGDERPWAGMLFCGAEKVSGRPYCDEHCRITVTKYQRPAR